MKSLRLAVCFLLVLGRAATSVAVGSLPEGSTTSGWGLHEVAVGDGDGDGHGDIAVRTMDNLFVLWNDGGPVPAFSVSTGDVTNRRPSGLVFRDLDGDGRAEIAAVGHAEDTALYVYRPAGGRAFLPYDLYTLAAGVPDETRALTAVDLDGDTLLELVAAERGSLSTLHNLGGSLFAAPADQGAVGNQVIGVLAGDFDAAPGRDVVAVRVDGFRLFRNRGDGAGNLDPDPPVLTGRPEQDMVAADLDGDGVLDLLATSGGITDIWRNDGNGSFTRLGSTQAPIGPTRSRVGDVNGDGRPDLVVAALSGIVSIAYGDGALGFLARDERYVASTPIDLALGDLNGDGDGLDLAYVEGSDQVRFAVSAGTTVVSTQASSPVPSHPVAVAALDLSFRGNQDLAVLSRDAATITLFANDGAGSFSILGSLACPGVPQALGAADATGDGRRDLLALATDPGAPGAHLTAGSGGWLLFYRNRGLGIFDPPLRFAAGQGPTGLAPADLDRDGMADVAVADADSDSLLVLKATGTGFVPGAVYPLDFSPRAVVARDLDRDGFVDLAVAGVGPAGGRAVVLWNSPAGPVPGTSFAAGIGPVGIVAPDLDLDGRSELVLADRDGQALLVLAQAGSTWSETVSTPLASPPTAITSGDFNCDTAEDVAITVDAAGPERLLVFLSEATGVLAPPQSFAAGMGPAGLVAGDLDHLGAVDLALAASGDDKVEVSLDRACGGPPACVPAPLAITGDGGGCAGQAAHLSATPGFLRYLWSNRDQGPEARVPLAGSGPLGVSVMAFDASGCPARASSSLLVDTAPTLQLLAAPPLACTAAGARFTVSAVRTDGALGELVLSWSVESPGAVSSNPDGTQVSVAFPPGTSPGAYVASLTGSPASGCAASATLPLVVADDQVALQNVAVRLARARDGSGSVTLEWDPDGFAGHDVLRAQSPRDMAGATVIGSVVGGTSWVDTTPPAGLQFYAVRPTSCVGH